MKGNKLSKFYLNRKTDINNVSGTRRVAQGYIFYDGTVAMRWISEKASTSLYKSIFDVIAIHDYHGDTEIEWIERG